MSSLERLIEDLKRMSTCNVSDALDKLGLRGVARGIRWLCGKKKVVGRAVTVKVVAAGLRRSKHHLGVRAIMDSKPGDIIVVDNRGRTEMACWGDLLSYAAMKAGVEAVVADGVVRDIDSIMEMGFTVFARGAVPTSARGRVMEEAYNVPVECGGIPIRPGDIVFADLSGVVVIPQERAAEVVEVAKRLYEREEEMFECLRKGMTILEVDKKFRYEEMLRRDEQA